MSLFEQMAQAVPQNRGLKITEPQLGQAIQYVVQIDNIRLQESNRGMGTLFVVEFTIKQGTEKTPTGQKYSWVQMPTYRPQTDPPNIKSFVAACLGVNADSEIPPSEFEAATKGKHTGKVLNLTVEHIQTQQGRDFFAHRWMPSSLPVVPVVPVVPELTKQDWLSGKGVGVAHPENPIYEYNPQHPDWGTRIKK